MKKFLVSLFILCVATSFLGAQVGTVPSNGVRHKMAIFTPLYLDAAFNADGSYRYSGTSFPREAIPGLEFYHGALMAIDSLNQLNIPLDVYLYDSKSAKETLETQFNQAASNGVNLIIANSTISELDRLSKLAAAKKILVINANVPNDGNARNNPYFVVMNPTLQTQGEQIYEYLKKNYPNRPIVYLTKKGNSENYLKSIFETLNKYDRTTAMHIRFTEVKDSLSQAQIQANLDPAKSSLFVIGSLDNNFSDRILHQLSNLSRTYPQITVMGMPTWDNLNFSKYKGLELIYSNPFYNARTDVASKNISTYYDAKMYARPTDLVFRAFGLTYRFGRLLNQYGNDLSGALTSKQYRVFYDYDIRPVMSGNTINYYENKKLYFLKYFNGSLKEAL